MKKYTIVNSEYCTEAYEEKAFRAVDSKGEIIMGTHAIISRKKEPVTGKFGPYVLHYPGIGNATFEVAKQSVDSICEAMNELQKLKDINN